MDQYQDPEQLCPLNGHAVCPLLEEYRRMKAEIGRLRELSQTDSLTGLFNLRYLLNALEGEMERTRRTGLPTSLIMIDLDRFKYINDTYGHEFGNEALRSASRNWRESMRRIDIPCRYGGDEFAIILPGTHLQQALYTARRLKNSLEDLILKHEKERVNMTASLGVEAYTESDRACTVEDFIKKADLYLLEAKAKGGNCVCHDKDKTAKTSDGITLKKRQALFRK